MKLNLIAVLILFVTLKSYAQETIHLKMKEGSNVYQNKVNERQVLIISKSFESGEEFDLETNRYMADTKIYQIDPGCDNQNMVYVPPFLVNSKELCFVDFETNRIEFIGETIPPKDSFSFEYIYQDELNMYFLINGREIPDATHGYLKVKVVNKETAEQSILNISNDVPGFSGDMASNQDLGIVYYTLTTGVKSNILFTIPLKVLKQVIEDKTTVSFLEIANRVAGPFQGLSFSLLEGHELLLYINRTEYGNYDNYFIHKISGEQKTATIPDECYPIGVFDKKWLFNCYKNELLSFSTRDLLE